MNNPTTSSLPCNALSLALNDDSDAHLETVDPYKYGYPDETPEGEFDEEARLDARDRARDMNIAGGRNGY